MSLGGWRYVAASVIGSSHEKAGGTCQDANDCQLHALPAGEQVLAAAVADGAGSAVCGGEGAASTCRALLGLMKEHLDSGKAVEQVTRETVCSWITSIQNLLTRIQSGPNPGSSPGGLHKLNLLLEATMLLHSQLPLESVLGTMLDHAISITDADRGILLEPDSSGGLKPLPHRRPAIRPCGQLLAAPQARPDQLGRH